MLNTTYPILRSGWVLKPADNVKVQSRETVDFSHALYQTADALTADFISRGAELLPGAHDFRAAGSSLTHEAKRLRSSPALTMDFPAVDFIWNGAELETRACATVCAGDTRSKLWVRVGAVKPQPRESVADLTAQFAAWSEAIKVYWLSAYNEVCQGINQKVRFEKVYELDISLLSADSAALSRIIVDFKTTKRADEFPTDRKALSVIARELKAAGDMTLSDLRLSPRELTSVSLYSFPRYDIELHSVDEKPPTSKQTPDQLDVDALCVIDANVDSLKVIGVGFEPVEPKDFHRSCSYITSGEISFDVGGVF